MPLHFIVPGRLDQLTGGYLFDRHIVEGLRAAGRAIEVHELPGSFPRVDKPALQAAAETLRNLPDGAVAVLDGLALPAFADLLPAAVGRLKLVGFIHHPLALETGLSHDEAWHLAALEARLLVQLTGILCPSQQTADAMVEYGIPRSRIAVTPPGTEKPKHRPERPAHAGAVRLLSVASVTPRKGHLLLLDALAPLADRAWQLLCIGSLTRDQDYAAALHEAVARHGMAARVTLAGEWPPERMSGAYAGADAFVLPSYHEGYGMAFAEALAYGLPIIGTTAGAIPETVPADASLLVPPGDGEALTAALRMLLDSPPLRARLAAGAAAAGARLPDWTASLRQWAAALDRLAQ